VLVVQGALTLAARPLQGFAKDEALVAEMTAAGGVMMLAIGLSLLDLKRMPVASYVPALVIAPLAVWLGRRLPRREARA
jgi:hypothetical protein